MMKHSIKFIAIIFILSTTLESQAETKKKELASRLYVVSGLENDIGKMPEIIKKRVHRDLEKREFNNEDIKSDYMNFINDLIDSTYSPKI